jgi:type II secretory pathway pseudopilin PulG
MKINFIKLLYEEENDMKKNKGITLVALVVTIVVLLILAGVSINLVLGDNGIIAKAKEAQRKSAEASQNDLIGMNELAQQLGEKINGSTGSGSGNGGTGGKTEPETVPYLPSDDFHYDTSTSVDTGLIIADSNGNEYVWVVVPRTTAVYKTTGLGKTTFTDADYRSIETDLKNYTSTYGTTDDFSDTWYADTNNEGWLTEAEYKTLKNDMLKSVYENGGFYVGRYEAGIVENRTLYGPTNSDGKYTIEGMPTPVTKADAYPYTWVTRTQAQNLASNVNSGTKTSSLMFGVQWDLVLAFMHNKGNIADSTLTSNSTTIGNYKNNLWTIKNANAKYSTDYGRTFTACPNPFKKDADSKILLTTGADSSFSVQNIYDIAGNVYEWTLEKTDRGSLPCAQRGGDFYDTGSGSPAAKRNNFYTFSTDYSIGFRVTLW